VQLKPSNTSLTIGDIAWSYIDLCCDLGPKTCPNIKRKGKGEEKEELMVIEKNHD